MESPADKLKNIFHPIPDSNQKLTKFRCDTCKREFCGNLSHFRSHVLSKHRDIALNIGLVNEEQSERAEVQTNVSPLKKIKLTVNVNDLILGCVMMVVVSTVSMNLFNSAGWKLLTDRIFKATGVLINRKKIRDYLFIAYSQVKDMIRKELADKMPCLKFDSAMRFNKALFGCNVQYRHENKTVIRTLGVLEQSSSQTGASLCEQIEHMLHDFGKTLDGVYSTTSDRGKNMVKAGKLIREAQTNITLLDTIMN